MWCIQFSCISWYCCSTCHTLEWASDKYICESFLCPETAQSCSFARSSRALDNSCTGCLAKIKKINNEKKQKKIICNKRNKYFYDNVMWTNSFFSWNKNHVQSPTVFVNIFILLIVSRYSKCNTVQFLCNLKPVPSMVLLS